MNSDTGSGKRGIVCVIVFLVSTFIFAAHYSRLALPGNREVGLSTSIQNSSGSLSRRPVADTNQLFSVSTYSQRDVCNHGQETQLSLIHCATHFWKCNDVT